MTIQYNTNVYYKLSIIFNFYNIVIFFTSLIFGKVQSLLERNREIIL